MCDPQVRITFRKPPLQFPPLPSSRRLLFHDSDNVIITSSNRVSRFLTLASLRERNYAAYRFPRSLTADRLSLSFLGKALVVPRIYLLRRFFSPSGLKSLEGYITREITLQNFFRMTTLERDV